MTLSLRRMDANTKCALPFRAEIIPFQSTPRSPPAHGLSHCVGTQPLLFLLNRPVQRALPQGARGERPRPARLPLSRRQVEGDWGVRASCGVAPSQAICDNRVCSPHRRRSPVPSICSPPIRARAPARASCARRMATCPHRRRIHARRGTSRLTRHDAIWPLFGAGGPVRAGAWQHVVPPGAPLTLARLRRAIVRAGRRRWRSGPA